MVSFKTRNISSVNIFGERVDFITSNERLTERVSNLSHERYILEKLAKVLDKDDTFWDIGSCLGIHSFIIGKQLTEGKVISFEPMPSNRSVSIDNKSVNELDSIQIDKHALSNNTGKSEFDIRQSMDPGYGRHGLAIGTGYESVQTITVPTVKADELYKYPQPTAVKIDVEGAGPLVLEGMEKTLSDPECEYLIFETHKPNPVQPSHEDLGYTVEDIKKLIESYGFSVSEMENEYHLFCQKEPQDITKTNVHYIQGDITEFTADAVINSAGSSLYFGTGVAGAIADEAGEKLQEEAIQHTPTTVGQSVITDGYKLNYDYVLHAVSMPHHSTGQSTESTIYRSVKDALQKAQKHPNISSVICPAVGCGLGGVPILNGIKKIKQAIATTNTDSIDSINICLYTEDEYKSITRVY